MHCQGSGLALVLVVVMGLAFHQGCEAQDSGEALLGEAQRMLSDLRAKYDDVSRDLMGFDLNMNNTFNDLHSQLGE